MAFYQNPDDEENGAQGMNQPQNDTTQAPQQLSGGVASSSPAPSAPTVAAPKSTASGMTGFQNYQKANQGTATNKLGQAATSTVANQANQAKSSINNAQTAFTQKMDAGSLANRESGVNDVKSAVDAARNLTAGSQLAQPQQSRFQEVINAKYQGPESMRQSGDYNSAVGNVNKAQETITNSQTAGGRESLLRNLFSQGGNYTQGLNKLDAGILNASQANVQNLKNTAAQAGNVRNQLDQAQIASNNIAQNRAAEIAGIRSQARDAFTQGKTAEEAATETRLNKVLEDWNKLPDYFKNLIAKKGATNLNSLEAGILGINSGEGLYNLGKNAIATGVADKNKLISKDEQVRQAALASLGGLDNDKLLSTTLKYNNGDLAGTQSASDALDLEQTRNNLNAAEKAFRESAEARKITGVGKKKVSRGNAMGKKTKTYTASVGGNAGKFLEQAGYDMDSEIGSGSNIQSQKALLDAALNASSTARADDGNKAADVAAAVNAINPTTSALSGLITGSYDPLQNITGGLDALAPGAGKAVQDVRNVAGDAMEKINKINPVIAPADALGKALGMGSLSSGISSAVRGIDTGAMKAYGNAKAKQLAIKDLKKKYTNYLNSQGFSNRAQVVNNDQTNSRLGALEQLLANLDKTNKGNS
jgi:hypothetical protein